MKKCFFIAAAFLAAVACTRESIIPEEPIDVIVEENGPIQVTLVAGNPETRTELGVDDNLVKPFWSYGDNISVVKVPNVDPDAGIDENFEIDGNDEDSRFIYHGFTGNVTAAQQRSLSASFSGSVTAPGQYRAFYPEHTEEEVTEEYEWDDEVWTETYIKESGPHLQWDSWEEPSIYFRIPLIQHPTSTSFDPAADLLVSNPFTIEASGDQTLGPVIQNSEIPIRFTRVNAIVKVVFNPTGELRNLLQGEKVRRVSFNTMGSGNMGGEKGRGRSISRTRADIVDNNDNDLGLTGDAVYSFPYFHDADLASFDVNGHDYYLPDGCWDSVIAEYTDETAYEILSQDDETATYFMVFPSILQNCYDYYDGAFYEGLPIRVETDHYVITRDIKLPDTGIALQPSLVTTIKINLNLDNVLDFTRKGISLSKSETTLIPGDGEYVDLEALELSFPSDIHSNTEFLQSFTVTAPTGISLKFISYDEYEDEGYESYTYVENGYEGDCIYNLYLSVDDNITVQPDDYYNVTITYEGFTATCTVHVLDKESFADEDFITFVDSNVRDICVREWGGHIQTGKLSKYEASKVTSLNDAFKGNTLIESFDEFEFFTGLTYLDYNAFDGCTSLQSIKLPGNVTWLGNPNYSASAVFHGCTSLDAVDMSECRVLEVIGESAFEGCSSLETITLPASVKRIASNAFKECTSLSEVVFSDGSQLESIQGEYNYWTYPNQNGAFYGCSSLTTIQLPSTVKEIGYAAFMNCSSLPSINIPESVTALGQYAFYRCESLGSVSIPEGITGIYDNTFRYCYNLSKVTLPEGLTSIGIFAFYYCTGLHEIEFPASLTTFGYSSGENLIFDGVEFRSGTDNEGNEYHGVKFRSSTPPSFEKNDIKIKGKHWDNTANDGAGGWVDGVTVYVPRGSKDAYMAKLNINSNITDTELRNSLFVEFD